MVSDPDSAIIRRELDTNTDNPAVEVANAVADIEDTDATKLSNMYDCVDGMLDELFSTPPSAWSRRKKPREMPRPPRSSSSGA